MTQELFESAELAQVLLDCPKNKEKWAKMGGNRAFTPEQKLCPFPEEAPWLQFCSIGSKCNLHYRSSRESTESDKRAAAEACLPGWRGSEVWLLGGRGLGGVGVSRICA